jgi:DNA-binding ferritin-like protein
LLSLSACWLTNTSSPPAPATSNGTSKGLPISDSKSYIQDLLAGHDAITQLLRTLVDSFADEYHDMGSSDFVTGLMEEHEKMSWFLRAHLG